MSITHTVSTVLRWVWLVVLRCNRLWASRLRERERERACVYTTTAEVEQSDAKCRNREPATGRALQTLIAASARTAGGGFADHSPGGADVCRCPWRHWRGCMPTAADTGCQSAKWSPPSPVKRYYSTRVRESTKRMKEKKCGRPLPQPNPFQPN